MELRHIRYFLAVARERNFTRAAAAVGIGQSPLSQQIRDLEREVGTPLFRRVPQGAELTAAGEAFLEAVRDFPALADRAAVAAQRAARGETGHLALGFTASSAFNPIVPATIRDFRRMHPEVRLTLVEANSRQLVERLAAGTLDAAILRPGMPGMEAFRLRRLCEEPMVVALPERHSLAGSDAVRLETLVGDPLLLFPREVGPVLYDTVIEAFHHVGVTPRLDQTAPQIASVINLVAAGMGFSIVPATMTAIAVAGVVYRPVDRLPPVARLALATRRGDTNPTVRSLFEVLADTPPVAGD